MLAIAQVAIGGLIQGSVFAIIALGFSLVYRVSNVTNLSQGAFCVLGAMGMYFFQVQFGWPIYLAAPAAVFASTIFAVAVGALTFVPGITRLPSSSALMLTAGLLTFFTGFALIVWGNQPYSLPTFSGEAPVVIGGMRVPTQGFWVMGGAIAIIVGLRTLLNKTNLGLALRACAENPAAARLMGINLQKMMLLSFGLAAFIGSIGGILIAPLMSLQFDGGSFFTISGFIAVAIGGMGSFAGAIVGGLLLGVAEQFAAYYLSSLFANSLALALLFATLILRPNGILKSGPTRRSDVRDDTKIVRSWLPMSLRQSLIATFVIFAALATLPSMGLPAGLLQPLLIALTLYIAVIGLDVLMGYAGQVSLGHAGFMAVGGYCSSILATTYGWHPVAGIAVGILLSLICACLLAAATARLRGLYLALATLAFGLLIDSFLVGFGDLTGGPSGLVGIPSFRAAGVVFDTPQSMFYLVLGIAFVIVLLFQGALRLNFGRALKAVRSDQLVAEALGINVARIKVIALCISAAIASLAGSLFAFSFHFLSPDMLSTDRSFELIAMLVLGGEGTLIGGLFGALLLTLLPTFVQEFAAYKIALEGAVLIGVFLLMPDGLFGRLGRALRMGVKATPKPEAGR